MNAAITPEKSEVKISHRPSAWGYLSAILATLAPCFAPPLAILLAFALLFPGTLTLSSYDPVSAFSALAQNFIAVAGAIFNSDLTDPANALFIYLLVALSLTSGASKTDFRIVLDATRRFWYFAVFLVLIFASALELVRFLLQLPDAALLFYPFASLLVLSSLTVLAGLLLALVLAAFLRNMGEFGILRKLASFLAFPFAYVVLIYSTLQLPYPYFSTFLLSVLFAFLAQFALKLLNPYLQKKGPAPANHTRLRRR